MDDGSVLAVLYWIFMIPLIVLGIVAQWKVFTKAGKPGWACIVPIYNFIVLLEIVGRPLWWIILMFIPLANIIASIVISIDLAEAFGQGGGFAAGLILLAPVFWLILGFGSATYQGPPNTQGPRPLPGTTA